jgi:hypothetical protein
MPETIEALLAKLPGSLREKLIELQPLLEKQGCVARRLNEAGRKPYRLRYRVADSNGALRHRSIDLPDTDTAVWIDAVLRAWQFEHKKQRVKAQRKRPPSKPIDEKKLYRRMLGELAAGHGATVEQKANILRTYDESAAKGVYELFRFVHIGQDAMPVPKRGRPALGQWY